MQTKRKGKIYTEICGNNHTNRQYGIWNENSYEEKMSVMINDDNASDLNTNEHI